MPISKSLLVSICSVIIWCICAVAASLSVSRIPDTESETSFGPQTAVDDDKDANQDDTAVESDRASYERTVERFQSMYLAHATKEWRANKAKEWIAECVGRSCHGYTGIEFIEDLSETQNGKSIVFRGKAALTSKDGPDNTGYYEFHVTYTYGRRSWHASRSWHFYVRLFFDGVQIY